jgi:apolipoprotein N-acyltransferase
VTSRASDTLLAALSGVLLALSFPKFGHPAIAWIALTPLIVAIRRGSTRRAFFLGLLTGGIYFAGTVYWISRVMVVYGGLQPWLAVPVHAALVAVLACFVAAFSAFQRIFLRSFGPRALLASPFVWVTTELGRTYLFTGFPWVLLGYSQVPVLPVAQFASLFGVYGVSALVCAVSAAAAYLVMTEQQASPAPFARRARPVMSMIAVVLFVAAWGARRVGHADLTRAGQPIRVGLVQGNVDQAEKWDTARATSIFADYIRMTRQAIADGAQLVVWPESSAPFYFEEPADRAQSDVVRTIARQAGVSILIGSDQMDRGVPTSYYNSAFLVNASGETAGVYRKMHLVPFGEYVPLKRMLFFAAPLVESIGEGFAAGTDAAVLPVSGHPISTAICYEVVYPNLVRQFVRQGSQLLTTITNDAWFGDTSAPHQHFAQAAMRAVEEGRYLARSANTGISGIVDPYGRVLAESRLYQPAVIVGEVRFLTDLTLYARIGDLFAYAAVLVTLVMLLQSRLWPLSTT